MSKRHFKHHVKRRRLSIRSSQRAIARARGNALAVNLFSVNDRQRRR
ncbi:hypothetical protein [Paenibacillus sp. NPDC055715]